MSPRMRKSAFLILTTLLTVARCYPNAGDLDSLIDNLNGQPNKGANPGGYGGAPNAPKPITAGALNSRPPSTGPNGEPLQCVTEHGENGECVQYYLCNDNNTINTDGAGIIDIRAGHGSSACEHYMDTCCLPGDKREHPITQKPPIHGGTGTGGHGTGGLGTGGHGTGGPGTGGHGTGGPGNGGHGSGVGGGPDHGGNGGPDHGGIGGPDHGGNGGPDHGGHGTGPGGHDNGGHADFKDAGCGVRNENGVGFRIQGDKEGEAQFGEFTWMVAILREEPVSHDGKKINAYQCGGSLIHPKVVLTAAHCVIGSKDSGPLKLKIRAGEWDTQTKKEILPHQDRNVVKIIHHEHYYAGGLYNDIAVLILDSPVHYAENVGVVCLPPANQKPPLTKCIASGWGKDLFGKGGRYQVILKRVKLPIVEHAKCQKALRKTRLGARFELHRTFICAGGEAGKDTCKGDGGSPLVCPMPDNPGRYMQSGIVAWGIGCGENLTPGVYANVGVLREWIDDQMHLNGIDLTPYQHY